VDILLGNVRRSFLIYRGLTLGELQSLAAGVFGLPSGNDLVAVAQSVSDSAPIVFPLSALIHSPEAFDSSQLLAILNQHNEEDLLAYLTGSSVSRPAGVSRRLAPRNPYRGPPSGRMLWFMSCTDREQ